MQQEFEIAETEDFIRKIKHRDYKTISHKIENFVYPQLKLNPFFGPNIKKLKGKFKELYRYRVGNFRLFYAIDSNKVLIIMIDIEKRKDSYK